MTGIVPIYQRITSYYISRILNQEFQSEQSIDSINKIMLRHQVSRKTSKLILRIRAEKKLIQSKA
jgi:DNA-binding transcriptional regulator YhcF (GntR family)